ncbi:Phenylalanine--tRNA ligase beta subunit [bioreactor metagenome]|uniref:Phenylalanine--tRNA ligase beta subunit n=1 Tax=bioreactor metagenome TaxID=1076179 RepID=A0A644VIM2_9ZZZZ|nr:phenylalanine--tRNA ligase subunit beta [Negativicutes bacterium]
MLASINWLKDYVEFDQRPAELADRLTMAGVPVATIEELGKDIKNVVTGKITAVTQHPNADKLSVCKVDVGREVVTIVTGATNIKENDIIPVALVGATLPNHAEINASELRGVMSNGMMCSTTELGIDSKLIAQDVRDGIYILPADTKIGLDIKEVLGLNDIVLEFELTANRADCFSMIGLAREIAVLTGGSLKKPMVNVREAADEKIGRLTNITIEDSSLCSRFACRILQNIKVGPSPLWMQHRLQAAGMRPISNIVDVTNFVMLEMGQPMHAYDYNLLAKHSIIVRKANPGERLTTLDGQKRELTADMLVIADAMQAVGIAGVMGGLATEVTNRTQTVLLEAASFNGASIRRTSRALGLRSEASGRFERGVDTANIMRALDRAAKLLEDMGACKVCQGVVDNYPNILLPKQVAFTPEQINNYLGSSVEKSTMIDIMKSLEFQIETENDKILTTVPTWRGDVSGLADISEEIARVYGYNKIPSTTPFGDINRGSQDYTQSIINTVKTTMTGAGFDEIISYSFSNPQVFDKLNVPENSPLRDAIPILNPITDDFPILRTTLTGGLLQTIVYNLSRKNEDMKIFEVGAVFWPEKLPLDKLPNEHLKLCGALVGNRNEFSWDSGRDCVDFYDAKGQVETILNRLGISEYEVSLGEHYSLHPGKTAQLNKDGEILGIVGEVHPKVLDAFGINRKVYLFEMDIECLTRKAKLIHSYSPLPKFPAVSRDLAVILPIEVSAVDVETAILKSAGSLLKSLTLFDVYMGEQVPAGLKSMAFSLTFQAQDRTLTDVEIDGLLKNTIVHLQETFSAKLRE